MEHVEIGFPKGRYGAWLCPDKVCKQVLKKTFVCGTAESSQGKVFVPTQSAEHAQLSAPPGSDKRFGTLQILMHGASGLPQPKISMRFRGKGLAMGAEKSAYHPDVFVI